MKTLVVFAPILLTLPVVVIGPVGYHILNKKSPRPPRPNLPLRRPIRGLTGMIPGSGNNDSDKKAAGESSRFRACSLRAIQDRI
jgi:hypothetical protein